MAGLGATSRADTRPDLAPSLCKAALEGCRLPWGRRLGAECHLRAGAVPSNPGEAGRALKLQALDSSLTSALLTQVALGRSLPLSESCLLHLKSEGADQGGFSGPTQDC